MIPRTDKERIYQLEGRVAELEAELAEYRRQESVSRAMDTDLSELDGVRCKLRGAHGDAGGPTIALMLKTLVEASPRVISRDRMFALTRTHRSWAAEDNMCRTIDVQFVKLRKALANLGYPDVIQTMNGRGWMIEPTKRDMIRATLGL